VACPLTDASSPRCRWSTCCVAEATGGHEMPRRTHLSSAACAFARARQRHPGRLMRGLHGSGYNGAPYPEDLDRFHASSRAASKRSMS
jgi:hypothetical protein